MIKPIETVYNGYRFRSRLEARWAVFFSCMGINYKYEPEGFDLYEVYYLPDFYLPEQKLWIEVKPTEPDAEEIKKARLLKEHIDDEHSVGILYGDPWVTQNPEVSFDIDKVHYCLLLINGWFDGDDVNCLFSECRRCGRFLFSESISSHLEDSQYGDGYVGYGCCNRMGLPSNGRLKASYEEARQARFEHDERKTI